MKQSEHLFNQHALLAAAMLNSDQPYLSGCLYNAVQKAAARYGHNAEEIASTAQAIAAVFTPERFRLGYEPWFNYTADCDQHEARTVAKYAARQAVRLAAAAHARDHGLTDQTEQPADMTDAATVAVLDASSRTIGGDASKESANPANRYNRTNRDRLTDAAALIKDDDTRAAFKRALKAYRQHAATAGYAKRPDTKAAKATHDYATLAGGFTVRTAATLGMDKRTAEKERRQMDRALAALTGRKYEVLTGELPPQLGAQEGAQETQAWTPRAIEAARAAARRMPYPEALFYPPRETVLVSEDRNTYAARLAPGTTVKAIPTARQEAAQKRYQRHAAATAHMTSSADYEARRMALTAAQQEALQAPRPLTKEHAAALTATVARLNPDDYKPARWSDPQEGRYAAQGTPGSTHTHRYQGTALTAGFWISATGQEALPGSLIHTRQKLGYGPTYDLHKVQAHRDTDNGPALVTLAAWYDDEHADQHTEAVEEALATMTALPAVPAKVTGWHLATIYANESGQIDYAKTWSAAQQAANTEARRMDTRAGKAHKGTPKKPSTRKGNRKGASAPTTDQPSSGWIDLGGSERWRPTTKR